MLGWLASIGAERQITDKTAKVPQLTDDEWTKLQPKSRKAVAKQAAVTSKKPSAKLKQQQQPRNVAVAQPAAAHKPPSAAAASKHAIEQEPTNRKATARPRKKAKTREACEYCSKTTHDSEDCPIKLAAEEGSEAEISEDDDPHDQPHGHPHGRLNDPMDTDGAEPAPDSAEEESGSEEEPKPEPVVAPAPLRHETIVRRNPGREVPFSPEVQVLLDMPQLNVSTRTLLACTMLSACALPTYIRYTAALSLAFILPFASYACMALALNWVMLC